MYDSLKYPFVTGKNFCLPKLPCVPGDEGVGEVVERGHQVSKLKIGQRVVITTRLTGTWRYYGMYHERDVHAVTSTIPIGDASMITISPCTAYRLLKDFRKLCPGDTVIQNGASSPVGQCVIQFCKAWDIKTYNIVANQFKFEETKDYLLSLGASEVVQLEEAEALYAFTTSVTKPVLGLNCLDGRFEDVVLRLMQTRGDLVYYGCAFSDPMAKRFRRWDLNFHKFHLCDWDARSPCSEKTVLVNEVIQSMASGILKAPRYEPIPFRNYVDAFKYTPRCEAYTTGNYVFDFTVGE